MIDGCRDEEDPEGEEERGKRGEEHLIGSWVRAVEAKLFPKPHQVQEGRGGFSSHDWRDSEEVTS